MSSILSKSLENQRIVWFQNSNSYLILDTIVAIIIEKLDQQLSFKEILQWTSEQIDAPEEALNEFLENIVELYSKNIQPEKKRNHLSSFQPVQRKYNSKVYYQINDYVFLIECENEYLVSKVFPTFAHLQIENTSSFDYHYQVYEKEDKIIFLKDNTFVGDWNKNESHVFQGKLSMQIMIDIYKKPEEKWMGVFHASALSNRKESMLFLGDSGNGKSTSLALLNANGFHSIADDFVPIDIEKHVYSYPAAISVKKKSLSTLLPFYPELETTAEYHFKKLNKIVRFLPL